MREPRSAASKTVARMRDPGRPLPALVVVGGDLGFHSAIRNVPHASVATSIESFPFHRSRSRPGDRRARRRLRVRRASAPEDRQATDWAAPPAPTAASAGPRRGRVRTRPPRGFAVGTVPAASAPVRITARQPAANAAPGWRATRRHIHRQTIGKRANRYAKTARITRSTTGVKTPHSACGLGETDT